MGDRDHGTRVDDNSENDKVNTQIGLESNFIVMVGFGQSSCRHNLQTYLWTGL